jgi:lactate dehydrogenase-like 2-hydroxyacid dehydrogenase
MNNPANRLKILVTRQLTPAAETAFAAAFDAELNPNDRAMPISEICRKAEGCIGLAITSMDKFDAAAIAQLPDSVKILATVSVGFDHVDIAAAKAKGLTVTNTPGVLTDATADIAMLLLLGAARGAHWGERMVRENRWPGASIISPLGYDVSEQTLGILGMGRIGQAVARRAHGFGMKIHYHNRRPVSESESTGATFHATLNAMLPHCHFLSINCAMTTETKNLINAETLALLPKGAIVVNTARGGIVDDNALISVLNSGHIAAAGLDVFAGEPNIDPRYRDLPNVFLLPHLGSATLRTRTNMGLKALANLQAFAEGKTPPDPLT